MIKTAIKLSSQECIHELFEKQARKTPHSPAVTCGAQTLTYQELNRRANQLARRLSRMGVTADRLVGVCLHRSINLPIVILGILKAGGAWLPLDPLHPRERHRLVLNDSTLEFLVTEESLLSAFEPSPVNTILVESLRDVDSQVDFGNMANTSSASDLAYIMYTSGSTGQPTGVMITHGNLAHYVSAMREPLAITAQDVYLHTATVAFSSSVRQFMVPFAHGACVVIATNDEIRQPFALFERIKKEGVTILDLVPSYWRACIDLLSSLDERTRNSCLDNQIRLILTASEPLPPDLPKRWRLDLGHRAQLINMFGQTETTGIVSTYRVPDSDELEMKTVPIGAPILGTDVYVLNDEQQPVSNGDIGEIYICGPGVGRGYLNQPEATARRFVLNPFNGHPEDGVLYRTGDMGRYREDGVLEFLGRADHQVKIHGVRVELGEVEATLSTHPNIKETVVVVETDNSRNQRLVAHIVARSQPGPSGTVLRNFLREKLPENMIPSAFVTLDVLPRLPTGKLDRKRLPVYSETSHESSKTVVAPRNALELQLIKIFQSALKLNAAAIGVTDNFFDLGGDSLAALVLISHIERVFGRRLPLTALFQAPTVEELSLLVNHEEPAVSWSTLMPFQAAGSRPPLFWVHGEFNDAYLPRHLAFPDQPVYGLVHQSQDGYPAQHRTVEEMASHYLSEIRSVQPSGPYFLGGFCFGALIAIEIAQQLKRNGEEVPFLLLLEPSPLTGCGPLPLIPQPGKAAQIPLTDTVSRHQRNLSQLRPGQRFGYVSQRVLNLINHHATRTAAAIKRAIKLSTCAIYHRFGRPLPNSLRGFYILAVYRKARRKYELRPYDGSLSLFVPRESFENVDVNWDGLATGEVHVHKVPGSHANIMREPYIQIWTEKLHQSLNEAQNVYADLRETNDSKLQSELLETIPAQR